ncbi:antitoxin VbhA family protein [Faecalicatena contorta]|uniref:Antitoxin VbhA domain-containing protein n=1 Tax=Faecalicatena contorta TaxID=39482 RepID=A0A315ZQU1_9FIRM|nr:antitoxin VbhA family protein [Faecalicatena contorta]PWJ47896.1 hypothetical protein A8805_11515 [Faecalicatena contorta]SUQ15659.1 hypothetical protein SAMN05216529_11515 [Faecalicatena contorta]
MTEYDRIIKNIDASMAMEGMPLTIDDKQRIRACLEGKTTFQDVVNEIIKKHTKQAAM